MQLELNLTLLEKFLEELEAKSIETAFGQLVNRWPKAVAAASLARLAEKLAHYELASVGLRHVLRQADALYLFLVIYHLLPIHLKHHFWHLWEWQLSLVISCDEWMMQGL